jgi:hypothetical protein
VTCSVFAPKPNLILEQLQLQQLESTGIDPDVSEQNDESVSDRKNQVSGNKVTGSTASNTFPKGGILHKDKENTSSKKDSSGSATSSSPSGYVVISGDYDGGMNVFLNVLKPKHSSLPSASSVSITST